jgi:hypothetical protein
MKRDAMKKYCLLAVFTLLAGIAGCRSDTGSVGSDLQGLRGSDGGQGWGDDRDKDADELADEADGGRHHGRRGDGFGRDDADGGTDERDCRGGWRGGFGRRGGGFGDHDDNDSDGWGDRR